MIAMIGPPFASPRMAFGSQPSLLSYNLTSRSFLETRHGDLPV